jgi:hypothetical protein
MVVVPGGIEWLVMLALFSVVPVVLFWRIFRRAGLPAPLALIALFPGFGHFVLLCVLALADWPILQDNDSGQNTT